MLVLCVIVAVPVLFIATMWILGRLHVASQMIEQAAREIESDE